MDTTDTLTLDLDGRAIPWRTRSPGRLLGGLIIGPDRTARTAAASQIAAHMSGFASVAFGDPSGNVGADDYSDFVYEADNIEQMNTALTHRFTDPDGPKRWASQIHVWNSVLIVEDTAKVLEHPDAGPGLERLALWGSKVGMAVVALAETLPAASEGMRALAAQNFVELRAPVVAA